MASRLELQLKLESLLGNTNVYYQPPLNKEMKYPCIVFSKNNYDITYADNTSYLKQKQYQIIVISRLPDHPVIEKIMDLPMCYFDRHYVSDNLHHDILTLYY